MESASADPTARPSLKAERSEATRAELLAAARRLFAERGYAGVGTEEIVRAAGVTRGALYHHFESKRELLAAVYEQVERELTERIATEAFAGRQAPSDPVEALRRGAELFLDACLEPDVQRIVLLDAPAVLGWERWREVAAQYGLGGDRRRGDHRAAGGPPGARADGCARRGRHVRRTRGGSGRRPGRDGSGAFTPARRVRRRRRGAALTRR